MKICGCLNCKNRGEVNPYELFEEFLVSREEEFEKIFKSSYTVGEASDLYEDLEEKFDEIENPKSDVVKRINEYGVHPLQEQAYWINNWMGYGGPCEI